MGANGGRLSGETAATDITVRRAVLDDLPAILEIANWATCHSAANFKTEPDKLDYWVGHWETQGEMCPWLVAEADGAVLGFAMAAPFNNRCGYAHTAEVSVYVEAGHFGRGVGKALYARLIPTLAEQGYRTAIGVIALPNPASVRLHEAFGFRKVGVLARVGWKLEQWHDVGYWQLMLRDDNRPPNRIKPVSEIMPPGTGAC
jgi:phosphinothricin acetyltransferase